MHLEIRQTKDGSNTLFVPDLNEHYHSVHGALQESQHVFITHGLEYVLAQKKDIKVLEIGFGTGLNAILTFPVALAQKAFIQYDTLEKHPLADEVVQQLHAGPAGRQHRALHVLVGEAVQGSEHVAPLALEVLQEQGEVG